MRIQQNISQTAQRLVPLVLGLMLNMCLTSCSTPTQQGISQDSQQNNDADIDDFSSGDEEDEAQAQQDNANSINENFVEENGASNNSNQADFTNGINAAQAANNGMNEDGEPVNEGALVANEQKAGSENDTGNNHQFEDEELPDLIGVEGSGEPLQNFSGSNGVAMDEGLPENTDDLSSDPDLTTNQVSVNAVTNRASTNNDVSNLPSGNSANVLTGSVGNREEAANAVANPTEASSPASALVAPLPINAAGANPPASLASTPQVPAMTDAFSIPTHDVMPALARLMWVGYDYREKERALRIEMITDGSPQFDVFMEKNRAEQPELVIRFLATGIRPKLQRDIDASEFRAPVAYVRMRVDELDGHVDVVLTMRDAVRPNLFAKDGSVLLSYTIPETYFAPGPTRVVHAVDKAQPLGDVNLMPFMENGSQKPKNAKLARAYVPDPGKRAFQGLGPHGGVPIDQLLSSDSVDVNGEGLPASFGKFPGERDRSSGGSDHSDNRKPTLVPGFVVESFTIGAIGQDDGGMDNGTIIDDGASPEGDMLGQDQEDAARSFSGRAVQLSFHETPLNLVLKAIEEESGNNFVYPQEVANILISVNMRDVPWDEALKGVLETYGLAMVRVGQRLTRIDRLENMNSYLERLERVKEYKMRLVPTKILVMRLSHSVAADAVTQLQAMLATDIARDPRTKVSADARTNSVVAEAAPYILAKIKNTLDRIDLETPQVEIASRIVEVKRDSSNFFGILWGSGVNFDPARGLGFGTLNFPNSLNSTFSVDPGVSGANSAGTVGLRFGSLNNFIDIDLLLKMEEKKGTTNVLQHNHVTVLDRQPARIEAGSSQYFRPAAGGAVIQAGGAGPVGGGNGAQGLAEVTFNLSLEVTPEVSASGTVNMTININSDTPSPSLGEVLANKNTRHVETKMTKRSGETGVIGGIYDTKQTKTTLGIPYLSDIPIIGALFRSTSMDESQMELLVMVTPTVQSGEDNRGERSADASNTADVSQTPQENTGIYENPQAAVGGNGNGSNAGNGGANNNVSGNNGGNTGNQGNFGAANNNVNGGNTVNNNAGGNNGGNNGTETVNNGGNEAM